MSDSHSFRQPGPRRPAGSPAGPDEVRRAVLDAAAALLAVPGVYAVPLRGIAAAAGVNLSLIRRYIGRRDELAAAVSGHVCDQLAQAVEENPLPGQGFSPDTVMGKCVRIAAALVISGRCLESRPDCSPVVAMAETLMAGYGLAAGAALRAAQIVAAALGWRIFGDYLVRGWRPGGDPAGEVAGRTGAFRAPAGRHPLALAARSSRLRRRAKPPSGACPEDRRLWAAVRLVVMYTFVYIFGADTSFGRACHRRRRGGDGCVQAGVDRDEAVEPVEAEHAPDLVGCDHQPQLRAGGEGTLVGTCYSIRAGVVARTGSRSCPRSAWRRRG